MPQAEQGIVSHGTFPREEGTVHEFAWRIAAGEGAAVAIVDSELVGWLRSFESFYVANSVSVPTNYTVQLLDEFDVDWLGGQCVDLPYSLQGNQGVLYADLGAERRRDVFVVAQPGKVTFRATGNAGDAGVFRLLIEPLEKFPCRAS